MAKAKQSKLTGRHDRADAKKECGDPKIVDLKKKSQLILMRRATVLPPRTAFNNDSF